MIELNRAFMLEFWTLISFENDTRCYHAGMFCDKETGEVLTDLLQIHILELKKLPPESQNETGIIQWMRFMSGKNRKDFAKMAEQNEYIKVMNVWRR